MGFRTSDAQRNVMGQSTEMSPLVSMLSRTFLNPLKFIMKTFNILLHIFACVPKPIHEKKSVMVSNKVGIG